MGKKFAVGVERGQIGEWSGNDQNILYTCSPFSNK